MKKALSVVSAVLFAVLYPFFMISSSFSVKNFYFGFHSIYFIYLRYIIIFIFMFMLMYLNRDNKRLITEYIPIMLIAVSLGIYIEYFITRRYLYNYAYLLWTGVVLSITNAGVFLGATAFVKEEYKKFYKRFWHAYIIIYILIIYVSFIREPNWIPLTINLRFGNGTLKFFKAVFNDPANNMYTSLVCFGNIFILLPFPFIISSIKRLNVPLTLIIGILLPLLFEGYQYVFKCGNVDVDDVFLNYSGYLIGMAIENRIYSKKLKQEV